jgi:DNA processing protein
MYPPEHRKLADRISKSGAVVSDYPLGTRPEPGNFPPRNRIISGLSLAVIVVEAGERSGALITARFAADQGRDVFAVPGRIYDRASRGANRLIETGAFPALSVDAVLEVLNLDLVAAQASPPVQLPEDRLERVVLEALSAEPLHIDELSTQCDLPIAELAACLSMLELRGRARQVGGMHYVRVRELGADYRVG